jgi:hypothetical protein
LTLTSSSSSSSFLYFEEIITRGHYDQEHLDWKIYESGPLACDSGAAKHTRADKMGRVFCPRFEVEGTRGVNWRVSVSCDDLVLIVVVVVVVYRVKQKRTRMRRTKKQGKGQEREENNKTLLTNSVTQTTNGNHGGSGEREL